MSEPIIGFPEVVKDQSATITTSSRQDDGRTGVGLRGDPCAVESVGYEKCCHHKNYTSCNLKFE